MLRVVCAFLVVCSFSQSADIPVDVAGCRYVMQQGARLQSPQSQKTQKAMWRWAWDLQQRMQANREGQSLAMSPFSLTSMFGMLYNGAGGKTREQLAATMQLGGLAVSDFNAGYFEITQALQQVNPGNILSFGNTFIGNNTIPFKPNFTQILRDRFSAMVENRDFSDRGALLARINGFIHDQTNKMIKDLVKNPPTVAALINAGYFKGGWNLLFEIENTQEWNFVLADSKQTKRVPMMFHKDRQFPYFKDDNLQMVSVPYLNGDFAMDLIVPEVHSGENNGQALMRVLSSLTADRYLELIANLSAKKVNFLGLPRWEIGSQFEGDLKEELIKTMPLVFGITSQSGDEPVVDFTNMSEVSAYLSELIHATLVKTNELGSEGAFVTYGGMRAFSSPADTISVIAERPFIAVIRHLPTNTPIFVINEWDPKPMKAPTAEEISQAKKERG